ncbi:hypothetical protein WJX72_009393 [[Myrmecia] bisecta]|uniref:Uncharacterized protein n=1 Tax=[Myrmecia] bisecta TaxID=41462 RepID=A0AAW1P2F3_9CHLO
MTEQVAAGKVVFAARAFQYERGKYVKGDQGNTKFQPDFSEEKAKRAQDLENNLSTVKDHPDVFGNMAVMLTGSAVRLDSPPFISQAAENVSRHAVALDMEASAFLAACDVCNVPALGVFKAVLDPMDSTKRQQAANYRLYAARALLFLMRVWRWYFNLPGNMAEQQEELGHNLADAYWRAFMEPVQMAMHLKQGPLGVQGKSFRYEPKIRIYVPHPPTPVDSRPIGDSWNREVSRLESSLASAYPGFMLVAPASLLKFH